MPARTRPSTWGCAFTPLLSGLDGDAGREGFHLVLPARLQRSFDFGHQGLVLGDLDQSLALQDLVHDRADALPLGQLLLAGYVPGAVWMRGRLGGQNGVLRARWQLHLLQEPAHTADGLAHAPGRAEQVQLGRWQLLRPGLPDVMDADRDAPGGHLLAELLRDHGPVAIFGGVQILDVHGESPARIRPFAPDLPDRLLASERLTSGRSIPAGAGRRVIGNVIQLSAPLPGRGAVRCSCQLTSLLACRIIPRP